LIWCGKGLGGFSATAGGRAGPGKSDTEASGSLNQSVELRFGHSPGARSRSATSADETSNDSAGKPARPAALAPARLSVGPPIDSA